MVKRKALSRNTNKYRYKNSNRRDIKREQESEGDRQTNRQERQRHRKLGNIRETERHRQAQIDTDRHRQTQTDDADRQKDIDRQKEKYRQTDEEVSSTCTTLLIMGSITTLPISSSVDSNMVQSTRRKLNYWSISVDCNMLYYLSESPINLPSIIIVRRTGNFVVQNYEDFFGDGSHLLSMICL